jgi:hypothetical protein
METTRLAWAIQSILYIYTARQVTALQHDNTFEPSSRLYNKTRSCPRRNLLSHHHPSLHFSHSRSSTIVTRSQYPGDTAFSIPQTHPVTFQPHAELPVQFSVPATKPIQWLSSRPPPFWALLPPRPTPTAASPASPSTARSTPASST